MCVTHRVILEVHQAKKNDVYHDRARIPEAHRGKIREGRICKVSVDNKHLLLEIRGIIQESQEGIIQLDDISRKTLQIQENSSYIFNIREVGWLGQFRWAWNASDSASRIAARLGLLGLLLGVIGLFIGIVSMVK